MDRAEKIACGKISLYFVKLMQQLLKPKLVRLMDDDEKRLIVLRRTRARLLQGEQLLQIEIAGVRQRRHRHMLASTLQRFNVLTRRSRHTVYSRQHKTAQ